MERSKFFNLNLRDFLKGLLMAVLTAFVTAVYEALSKPDFFTLATLKTAGIAAAAAFLAYLLKNLFTNSQGQVATKEPQ